MKIFKNGICLMLLVVLSSCSSNQSLQQYYVAKSENPNFISVDLPVSLLNVEKADLSLEQKSALESLRKLNILAFKKDGTNTVDYQKERTNIRAILKDSDFTELMKMKTSFGDATITYSGDEDAIDEVIVYGDNDEKGFLLVRILGDDMNPAKMIQFLQVIAKSDYNGEGLEQLGQFLKN